MTYSSLLIHYCRSGTSSYTTNSLGERVYTWTYHNEDIPCRFVPLNASETINLAGKYDNVSYRVYLQSGNHITTNERVLFNGEYYRVRDSRIDSSHHTRSLLVEELPE